MKRREFLTSSLALAASTLLWQPLPASAAAAPRALVLIHLFGGNDGLGCVAPFDSARLRELRPKLLPDLTACPSIGEGLRLHPALKPLVPLFESKQMAVVNGLGYPDPNFSHFVSSAIWQTAQVGASGSGWAGRFLDAHGGQAVSFELPGSAALRGPGHDLLEVPPDERNEEAAPLSSATAAALDRLYRGLKPSHPLARAHRGADHVREVLAGCPGQNVTSAPLRQSLERLLAFLPRPGVYHLTLSGFDTHRDQAKRHAQVLGQLATELAWFWREARARGLADRTLVLTYSEFGRRVEPNASGGTDHGSAGPAFLLGGRVRAGAHGAYPSLSSLDSGNLRYTVDFRELYAGVLEGWLGADSVPILGRRYDPLRVVTS